MHALDRRRGGLQCRDHVCVDTGQLGDERIERVQTPIREYWCDVHGIPRLRWNATVAPRGCWRWGDLLNDCWITRDIARWLAGCAYRCECTSRRMTES